MSNEKRAPGCLGYIGDDILPSYVGIIVNNEIRIPIQQPGKWKVGVFLLAQMTSAQKTNG